MAAMAQQGQHETIKPFVFRRLWDGLAGDKCVAPSRLLCRRAVGRNGAFSVAYSHSGRFLAVAACDGEQHYPIQIYDLDAEEGKAVLKGPELSGHVSIVYDLSWSEDDRFLISASADGTARVWALENITGPSPAVAVAVAVAAAAAVAVKLRRNRLPQQAAKVPRAVRTERRSRTPTTTERRRPRTETERRARTRRRLLSAANRGGPPGHAGWGATTRCCSIATDLPVRRHARLRVSSTANDGANMRGYEEQRRRRRRRRRRVKPPGEARAVPPVLTGAFDESLRMWSAEAKDPKKMDLGLLGGYSAPVHAAA